MTRYSLKVPQFQIFVGSDDITEAVVGFSFRHTLAEPSTPLIWTGTIEMFPVRSGLPRSFFDDELNPSRWLSGLQPIDVYFEGMYWQRFRIKPSGYRYNQDNGQAEIEITDIIGILDSYQPAADAPEFKTGQTNLWTDLAVNLIRKQASLMGISVSLQTPTFNNDGIYTVPKTVRGSYIKEAQKIAGERQWWMWSNKEVIEWVKYPQYPSEIAWSKSRKELLTFTRQQGLEPVVAEVTVSATNETIDVCQINYPRSYYTYVAANIATNIAGLVTTNRYQVVSSATTEDRIVTDPAGAAAFGQGIVPNLKYPVFLLTPYDPYLSFCYQKNTSNIVGLYVYDYLTGRGNFTATSAIDLTPIADDNGYVYIITKTVTGNPALVLFGGTIDVFGRVSVSIPPVAGYTITKLAGAVAYDWWLSYSKGGTSFVFDWQQTRLLLQERDVTTYENVPFDSINASKIVSRVITSSEPWAKYPDFMAQFGVGEWFAVNINNSRYVTKRTTTNYTYREIQRDDIIVAQGVKIYEIASIEEIVEEIYLYKNPAGFYQPLLVPSQRTLTTYVKECLTRWAQTVETQINKGQSTTSTGYLFTVQKQEKQVFSIPEIQYRPAPYPVTQKPLLAKVQTSYTGVSPYVQSRDFVSASTLTSTAELATYAKWIGSTRWQRYYSREIASGYSTTLNYSPFQGVYAGNGVFLRDRFGISLNREGDSWQFVEDFIGNKIAGIPEIAAPPIPYPPLLTTALNIGSIPDLNVVIGVAISPVNLTASGGTAPYTFSSSTLPTGLSISGSQIVGTPTAIATTSVTITVTDDLSNTASTTFGIAVVAAPSMSMIVSVTQELLSNWTQDAQITVGGGLPIPIENTVDWNETATISLQQTLVVSGTSDASGEWAISNANLTVDGTSSATGYPRWLDLTVDGISDSNAYPQWLDLTVDGASSITSEWLTSSVDTDATAVIAAIEITGVTLTTGQKTAINDRIVSAKSDGAWSKWVAYYGFVGGTAASHAINWKNPSNYLMSWNGMIAHNAFGIKGDGSTGYGDTGITPSTVFGSGDFGLGFYLTENKAFAVTAECGVSVSGSAPCVLYVLRDNLIFEAFNAPIVSLNTNTKSYMSGNTSTSLSKIYVNGSVVVSGSISPTTSATQSIYVCAANLGSAALFSQARLGSLSINTGLTDAEETANYISELAFQTALGRN